MKNRIELWVFPTGNVAYYRGSAYIPKEKLTEEERQFVLNKILEDLTEGHEVTKGTALESEIKRYTEELYHETFGNGQGTLDEFDWEDIAATIEETAHHFVLWKESQTQWKPSKDEERLINTSISFLKDFADKGYENAVECIDWLKSKLNGDTGK